MGDQLIEAAKQVPPDQTNFIVVFLVVVLIVLCGVIIKLYTSYEKTRKEERAAELDEKRIFAKHITETMDQIAEDLRVFENSYATLAQTVAEHTTQLATHQVEIDQLKKL